jgi:hypothetical protein
MRNYLVSILLLVWFPNFTNAQTNQGKSWIIGFHGYHIKFNSPIEHDTLYNMLIGYGQGSSNICDSNGDILISCNRMIVFNKNWTLIEDGDTLVPKGWSEFNQNRSAYTESSIILPVENKKYFVVTPAMNDTQLNKSLTNPPALYYGPHNLLLYHVVDMNANAGLGKVTQRMVPILENKELSKTQMMACRHANGKDWWLLKMAAGTNAVYKFLFTQDSVYNKGMQTIPFPWCDYYDVQGQMVFSRDGTKWATTQANFCGEAYLADFDRCTGMLSNFSLLTVPPQLSGYSLPVSVMDTNNTGICFSPSGNMLYIARSTHVLQYNISTQTYYKVCGWDTTSDGFAGYTSLMLGPDDKICIGNSGGTSKQMSVINNPDIANVGCGFCRKCLRSKANWGGFNVPPCMPNYELGALAQPCWPLMNEEVVSNNTSWEVYPNPAQGVVYIKHKDGKTKRLYNTMGQLLDETHSGMFDVSRLSKGIYFVQCEGEMKKVVVE